MSTHNIHLKYRTPKRYPTIISIVPPGMALIVTFRGRNYRCLKQILMVPKGFEPLKFNCRLIGVFNGQICLKIHFLVLLGPVVQSIVSLMSSLRVISLTVLADSVYNILIFFAEKNVSSFCSAKATHIFSAKNFSIFAYHLM